MQPDVGQACACDGLHKPTAQPLVAPAWMLGRIGEKLRSLAPLSLPSSEQQSRGLREGRDVRSSILRLERLPTSKMRDPVHKVYVSPQAMGGLVRTTPSVEAEGNKRV
jgi:hypothetical protein